QPDEPRFGKTTLQGFDRVDRVARAERLFDAGHFNAWIGCHLARVLDAFGEWRGVARTFERILRRDEPEDAVELQPAERNQADVHVRFVRRIERATEQADFGAGVELRECLRWYEIRIESGHRRARCIWWW